MKNFKLLLSISLLLSLFVFISVASADQDKFVSAHTIALDGVIPQGKILATHKRDVTLKVEIKEQLKYVIGQLNGLSGGSPDLNRLEVEITKKRKVSNNQYEVTYSAKLFIAWPRENPVPSTYTLKVPAYGNWDNLIKFTKTFGGDVETTKKCLSYSAHDTISAGIFWYYYRPNKYSCPLKEWQDIDPSIALRQKIYLKVSDQNTKGKYPEYGKIWEDDKLKITAIFGKTKATANTNWDEGVRSYIDTINSLITTFGRPTFISVDLDNGSFSDGIGNPEVYLTFDHDKGEIDVALFLVDGIRSVNTDFINKYNERTRTSDFISYSGHSGLGANIRALARMGEFIPNQYQIYLVNGCDTFAYVDDALRDAHQEVNPEFGKDKFIDVITNAMPSYFSTNRRTNMAVIKALARAKSSYKEILSGFDISQRAIVTGEQDNNWPKPF